MRQLAAIAAVTSHNSKACRRSLALLHKYHHTTFSSLTSASPVYPSPSSTRSLGKNMSTTEKKPKMIVYAMPGSQYSFKVLAAMSANDIDHYVAFVPVKPDDRKKVLPSGGTLVPELKVVSNEGADNDIVVPDSESILHWLDDNCSTNLFPTELASELSMRASDKTLAAMVWYYNWVDYSGYSKSMQPVFRKYLPGPLAQFVPDFVVDWFLASTRDNFRLQVGKALELNTIEGDDDASSIILDDEPKMRAKLIAELEYFQRYLLKNKTTKQEYLLPDTKTPTAADFSVYAQLERLVGAGTASDVDVPPALQELKDNNSLKRLWEWHDLMRERFPVQFKGKRPPEELLEKRT